MDTEYAALNVRECFEGGGRCHERCQCDSCKNREHSKRNVAQAIENIENCPQKSFQPPAKFFERESLTKLAIQLPRSFNKRKSSFIFLEAEGAEGIAQRSPRPICACEDGNCKDECPCLTLAGSCTLHCQCKGCQVAIQAERMKGCSCKKSNCLKLYCECFAAQRMCDHRCTCERCKNQFETSIERERAVALILERNPLAFQPKIASGSSQHLRGCNCRKSGCLKNYCECHQAGVACTSRCTCHQCRNTETFVSAKKMLDFAGVQTDKSNRRDHPERPSQRTRVKQPLRDESRKPSALEMLSRSAPLASSRMDQKNLAISGMLDQMPLLRSIDRVDQLYSSDEVVTTPKIATRKYARQNIRKITNTEQTVEANESGKYLPNVDDTVTNAYDARNTEGCGDPELTVLCRSLLYTAKAVEIAEEDRKTDAVSSKSYSHVDQPSDALKFQGAPNPSDSRETLSPTAAGLFCEEEYSEANTTDDGHVALTPYDDEPRATTANSKSNRLNRDSRSQVSLSAMQERAVLQEFSVWLRDLVANEPSH